MLKNKAAASIAMRDVIVYQMWAAHIGFEQINKWLAKMLLDIGIVVFLVSDMIMSYGK